MSSARSLVSCHDSHNEHRLPNLVMKVWDPPSSTNHVVLFRMLYRRRQYCSFTSSLLELPLHPGGHISPRGGSLRVLKGISWGHIRLDPVSSVWLLLPSSLGRFSYLSQETSRAGQHGVPDWQRLRHHRHCGHWWWLVRIRHLVHERYVSNVVLVVPVTC